MVGSGSGEAHQALRLGRPAVLPGQQVWVRELEAPTGQRAPHTVAEEGDDAIQERPATGSDERAVWIRWHAVSNFIGSDPRSRHYTLDRASGRIVFGDGTHGLPLPRGTQNVLATYRTGGGVSGNVQPGNIAQLTLPSPAIAGVSNRVAADGGAEGETVAMVSSAAPIASPSGPRGHWRRLRVAGPSGGRTRHRARQVPNERQPRTTLRAWLAILLIVPGVLKPNRCRPPSCRAGRGLSGCARLRWTGPTDANASARHGAGVS